MGAHVPTALAVPGCRIGGDSIAAADGCMLGLRGAIGGAEDTRVRLRIRQEEARGVLVHGADACNAPALRTSRAACEHRDRCMSVKENSPYLGLSNYRSRL